MSLQPRSELHGPESSEPGPWVLPPSVPNWSPSSWLSKPALQQPLYDSPAALERALAELRGLPPLVTSWEADRLKAQLAEAARGERFLLQGGDCAETFDDCQSDIITCKLKVLLQMSVVLLHGLRKPVTRVGRMAGQYAKPRTSDIETVDGNSLPSYRGDLINGFDFRPETRRPDPERLVQGYARSALTLNFLRGLSETGFADLHHPEYWDLGFVQHSSRAEEYQRRVEAIAESMIFVEAVAGQPIDRLHRVDFFTSHEGLHLPYEAALTRHIPRRHGWYDLSSHFPWIGMRTAVPDGAHVEFFRGIRNPIGLKVGPRMSPDGLCELVEILDPSNEPGRLTLIHRMGAEQIADRLPPLVRAVQSMGRVVLWCCDPMHGNTKKTGDGIKTRRFEDILSELEQAMELHSAMGTVLGGVHIELTGENVTECTGGARGLTDKDLSRDYRSQVDPRLSYEQAMELALRIARKGG